LLVKASQSGPPPLELLDQLVDLDPARVPVTDQVGQPQPEVGDQLLLVGPQPARGQTAEMHRLPEAVAGRVVVVVAQLGALGSRQPAEDDGGVGGDDVGQDLHHATLSASPNGWHAETGGFMHTTPPESNRLGGLPERGRARPIYPVTRSLERWSGQAPGGEQEEPVSETETGSDLR
jgi:hypothetical protein